MRTPFLLATASLLAFSLACGGSVPGLEEAPPAVEIPAEPAGAEAPGAAPTGTPTVAPTATPASAPAADAKPAAQAYPGTYTGVCERLRDCGCNPYASVEACAKTVEASSEGALAMAREMGVDADEMLRSVAGDDYLEEALYAQANADCRLACEDSPLTGGGGAVGTAPAGGGASASIELRDGSITARGSTGAGAAAEGGTVLVVRSLDDAWVDIRVDGAEVLELQDDEGTVPLAAGEHVVEVIEFASDDVVSSVRVYAGATPQVVVGVREDGPARCYDRAVCQVQ